MIREYKTEDRSAVEQCIFELQEEEHVRLPEYWQTATKAVEDGYLDYLMNWIGKSEGKYQRPMARYPDI